MDMRGKKKIMGLKAKRSLNFISGKSAKKAITGNKVKSVGMDLPKVKSSKPMMKAKRMK